MNPGNEARRDPGMEPPRAFPQAPPPPAFVSSLGCCTQPSQHEAAPRPTTNAVTPRWSSLSSSVGTGRSFRAKATERNVSAGQFRGELKGFSYPDHSYQQKTSYIQGVTFTSPAIKEEWDSEQNSLYACCGFPYAHENSLKKLHDTGSFLNSHSLDFIQEAASPQNAGSIYYDIEPRCMSEAMQFLPQCSLFHPVPINPASKHHMDVYRGIQATDNNKIPTLMSAEEKILAPTRDTLLPTNKRKIIQQDCFWSSNLAVEQHQLNHYCFPAPPAYGNELYGQNISETADMPWKLLRLFCPQCSVGCHHVAYPYPCLEVKESEKREWTRLLQKELTNTDVGRLGRIVLPKKEAEANLPPLLNKDGLVLEMVDMAHHIVWEFKYRFWSNTRSRMYILDNTGMSSHKDKTFCAPEAKTHSVYMNFSLGDFAKMNKLEIGDSLVIYGNRASEYYLVGVTKKATPERMITRNGATDQLLRDGNKEGISSDQKEGSGQPNISQVTKPDAIPFLMGFPLHNDGGSSHSLPQFG